jgi:hypothetical protein
MKYLFTILITTLIFTSCSTVTPEDPKDFTWVTYSNGELEFLHPENWRIDESGMMGSTCFVFSDKKENGFSPNINIMVQDVSGVDYDLDAYIELTEGQMKNFATELNMYSSEKYASDAGDYQWMMYSLRQGPKRIMVFQSITIFNSKAHVLTYTDMEENYDLRIEFAKHILQSFKVK